MAEAQPLPDSEEADAEAAPEEELVEGPDLEPPPKKPKQEPCPECESLAPAWMATFADLATLLMAFFVLILSFASVNIPRFEQVAGSVKLAFGVDRVVPRVSIPMGETIITSEFTPSEAAPTVVPSPTQKVDDPTREFVKQMKDLEDAPQDIQADYQIVVEALENEIEQGQIEVRVQNNEIVIEMVEESASDSEGTPGFGAGGRIDQSTIELARSVTELQQAVTSNLTVMRQVDGEAKAEGVEAQASSKYEALRMALSNEIEQGLAEVEQDGDSVIIRLGQADSFRSGSADIQQSFTATLRSVGEAVSVNGGMVRVEGHTDNVPVAFNERFNSNWDLSSARSAAVATYLLDNSSLPSGSVTITGLADSEPIADNSTAAGRARNRRIEIVIDG